MGKKEKISLFWFRRDLRLDDNTALNKALSGEYKVLPIFIFDREILDELKDKKDARLTFIHDELEKINRELRNKGCALKCLYTSPLEAFKQLEDEYQIREVYANRDYEPYARDRDEEIKIFLNSRGIAFQLFKDQVIFEPEEVLKNDGDPYLVYTPYSKRWLERLTDKDLDINTSALYFENWVQADFEEIIPLKKMGFSESDLSLPSSNLSDHTLEVYENERDIPHKDSTSKLGVHLRFGTASIRKIAEQAKGKSLTFLKELIWREFYMMILWHFPEVVEENFKSKYDDLKWRRADDDFEKWKKGETGFPLVDAGMRQLNQSGFMHNRVRMVVASFLTKHLLIDWRRGEAYFAEKLLDYELASNNGNWQWAAGTGVDAQPYFRIFNPHTQIKKYDPDKKYIRRWVEEYGSSEYPVEMVEHKAARERALSAFKEAAK